MVINISETEGLFFCLIHEEQTPCDASMQVVQGPLRAFGDPGTKVQDEAPCERSEQKIFLSCPLDWLKMHYRAFPAVKILKIFNYEAP